MTRHRLPLVGCGLLLAVACRPVQRQADAGASVAPRETVKLVYPGAPGSFVPLIKRVGPAVVQLEADEPVEGGPTDWLLQGTPTGSSPTQLDNRMHHSLGSGLLIDRQGHLLTNDHLLGKLTSVTAVLHDGRRMVAKVVGRDSRVDLAVLKLENARNIKPATLGDSDRAKVGQWIVILARPFGRGVTAHAGLLSSKAPLDAALARHNPWSFMQTDAKIHPGNSGGPVLSSLGKVIGIATATQSAPKGVGFILPINVATKLLPALKKHGKVSRVWTGMYIAPVTATQAKAQGMEKATGAFVTGIVAGGPAARAGLRKRDVILSFAGKSIDKANQLPWIAALANPGEKLSVVVWRDRKEHTFTLVAETMPE